MAREFAKILTTVWDDPQWRALTPLEQWLYLHLVSRSDLSYAGIADWRPKRIRALSSGVGVPDIELAASVLQARGYIVIDEDTEEVLVRSFHRNDGMLSQPNLGTSVAKAWRGVTSLELRGVIVHELCRLQLERPELAAWERLTDVLDSPAVDPAQYRQEPPSLPDAPAETESTGPPF